MCIRDSFAEAQILEALEVDFIDESEVLTPADENNHIWTVSYTHLRAHETDSYLV